MPRYIDDADMASSPEMDAKVANDKIKAALDFAFRYSQIDGDHHKPWVIDQMVRSLTGDKYETWIIEACAGEDGPEAYGWDEGIPP